MKEKALTMRVTLRLPPKKKSSLVLRLAPLKAQTLAMRALLTPQRRPLRRCEGHRLTLML